jgi:hypothetical protein
VNSGQVIVRARRSAATPSTAFAVVILALALGGCGEGGVAGSLRQAGVVGQPDEFMVLPTRPLEMPPSLSALPPPVPGATDRVAYRPREDAIVALTGRPPGEAPAAPGLVAAVGGADPAIRSILVAEDAEFRRQNRPRLLERWFRRDRDRLVYSAVTLDADAEWRRLRAAGLRVPAAPPAGR